ncbi:MAG: DMT family transporter [Desulfatirhabdiaceae bacterium]|nr:DMT family transporter [Desulfatirhabdiaceae bacterium]
MTAFALGLVLTAAFIHASWNYLAKRAGQGGAAFVWLFAAISSAFYAPVAIFVFFWQKPDIGPLQLVFMVGSALIHLAYFLLLQKGYREGDLSLVYPLARGTGPTISTLVAILFLGERPSALALLGAFLVAAGVFFLSGGSGGFRGSRKRGVGYGLLTGITIAAYTLWDKYAVSTLLIPPLLQDYCTNLGRVIMLAPVAFRKGGDVRKEWRIHRKEAIGVGLLCPLSYILVLTALVSAPVSYIAPAREVSILIAAVMGSRLLAEKDIRRRLPAAVAIVVGVIALAAG